jgi:hypothetical protein
MRDLIAAFSAAARGRLSEAGWRKRSGDVHTFDLGGGFQAWLGLNRASQYHPLAINPVVGLRFDPVERLLAGLLGERPRPSATIARPVGYLTSQNRFLQLKVATEDDAEPAADELLGLVNNYGLPFARRYADQEALTAAVAAGGNVPNPHRVRLLLPALQHLQGREEEAHEALSIGLSHYPDATAGPAAAEYHRFAAALVPLLAEQTPELS